jgi:hypothetical protein
VVAPPGGFEDAVRRGRRRRRKQTGGSSAAVLVLVGALAWSVVGHPGGGSDRLDQSHQPRIGQTNPLPYGTSTPAPFTSSAPTGQQPVVPGSGNSGRGAPPPAGAGPVVEPRVSHPATGSPHVKGRPYWPRPVMVFTPSSTNTEITCLPQQDQEWCTKANEVPAGTYYRLSLTVCHSVTGAGDLHVHRKDPVEFKVLDIAHNDTVWTFSLGQRVVPKNQTVTVNQGECVVWSVDWDGLDDFGDEPPPGSYSVTAALTADEHTDPSTSPAFQHD